MTEQPGSHSSAHGRRARPKERTFAGSLGLTVLSAILPGSGYLAAGRRLLGWALLTLIGVVVMLAIGVLIVEHDPAMLAAELASRPMWLIAVGIAVIVAAAAWIIVIISSHLMLRVPSARAWQRVVGFGLTLALCAGVLVPSVWASRASFATYNLVTRVFDAGPEGSSGGSANGNPGQPVDRDNPWQGQPRLNILLLGADAGDDRTGLRTDSVILASINTNTGDTVLLSLPRNLENVPFKAGSPLDAVWPDGFDCGYPRCILDGIYEEGVANADSFTGVKDPGAAAISDAVSATLGLSVDYYLMVDLGGFEALVNALGGVDINVGPEDIPMGGTDINGIDQPAWKIEEWVPAGQQHLNGRQALWYSRSRWHASDYVRMQRQRCMLNAIVKQANPQNLLANYIGLAGTAEDIISTDVPYQLFPAFVELAAKVKSMPVRSLAFTDQVIPDRANPDFQEIRRLVRLALEPPVSTTPPTSTSPPPTTTGPSSTTSPGETVTPSTDPSEAVVADDVCG